MQESHVMFSVLMHIFLQFNFAFHIALCAATSDGIQA